MRKNDIRVQIQEISSDQDWATDPDMIEVTVQSSLLEKAEKCIAFMQEHDVYYMVISSAMGYTLYALAENFDEGSLEGKTTITGEDGKLYVTFTPEYRLEDCNARIYKDGTIFASLPFSNSGGEVRALVANVEWLKDKFAESSDEVSV